MYRFFGEIGGVPLRSYGLVICLAIVLGNCVAYYLMKQERPGWHKHIFNISVLSGVAGIIGARLWDVFFFDWHFYQGHISELFSVWQGGLSIQGGIIFRCLVSVVYLKYNRIDTLIFFDIYAPAIVLGQSIGRCANFLNGDAFGRPTGSAFGILYPENTGAQIMYGAQPLWPVEIWEGQLDIIIFVLLLLYRTTSPHKGQTFCLYVVLYSFIRFFLEFLRYDYQAGMWGLKSAQVTSIVGFSIAAVMFIILEFRKRKRPATISV